MKLLTEHGELKPLLGVESNQVIAYGAEDYWGQQTGRELRDYLGPEVSAYRIHVVVRLSKKHWSLIWEDQDDILDCAETYTHNDKEQRAVSVLNTGCVVGHVVEQDHTEERSQHSHEKLNIRGLWETSDIQEVSLGKQLELIEPSGVLLQ